MRHITLPSGAVAKVSENVSPETIRALDEMVRAAIANLSDFRRVNNPVEYQDGDLEKFFGLDPDFTGDMDTAEYLDTIR